MEILKQLTEIEKAALLYRYYNGEKTYKTAYLISHPERRSANPDSLASRVSHWKNSPEVQKYMKEVQQQDQERINRLMQKQTKTNQETGRETDGDREKETNTAGGTIPGGWTNFQDITEFLNYLEIQANTIQEEKDKQTYLKMIAELMRFKEQDNNTKEIQRFYTPLQCSNCPLYQNEKKLI